MIRFAVTIGLIVLGFIAPVWLFILSLFVSSILLYNFWNVIAVTVLINFLYVYQGDFFSAQYILWGVVAYGCGIFVHRLTRLRDQIK